MNLNKLRDEVHANAVAKGFWDEQLSDEHCLMLICTEVAELVEADRKGMYAKNDSFNDEMKGYLNIGWGKDSVGYKYAFQKYFGMLIKNTIEDEFADIYIRLADLAGALGVDFDRMQPCRYYRAFDRFSFTENAFALIKGLSKDRIAIEKRIQFGMGFIEDWTQHHDVNLEWHIAQKMKYNQSREAMHGKKY